MPSRCSFKGSRVEQISAGWALKGPKFIYLSFLQPRAAQGTETYTCLHIIRQYVANSQSVVKGNSVILKSDEVSKSTEQFWSLAAVWTHLMCAGLFSPPATSGTSCCSISLDRKRQRLNSHVFFKLKALPRRM